MGFKNMATKALAFSSEHHTMQMRGWVVVCINSNMPLNAPYFNGIIVTAEAKSWTNDSIDITCSHAVIHVAHTSDTCGDNWETSVGSFKGFANSLVQDFSRLKVN